MNTSSAITTLCVLAFMAPVVIIFLTTAIKVVPEQKRLSVYRLGRYIGERGPGLVFLLPFIDRSVPVNQQSGTGNNQTSLFLVGTFGEARTAIEESGEVVINGVVWNATSTQSIVPGTRVRVKRVIVDVESV